MSTELKRLEKTYEMPVAFDLKSRVLVLLKKMCPVCGSTEFLPVYSGKRCRQCNWHYRTYL